MLVAPNLSNADLLAQIKSEYGIDASEIIFLPLGADMDSAVYRVATEDGKRYFLKLRRGEFPIAAVQIPYQLSKHGVSRIITPFTTVRNTLCFRFAEYTGVLSPYIPGESAWGKPLSQQQWAAFGRALHELHNGAITRDLANLIPQETFDDHWRCAVGSILETLDQITPVDQIAERVISLLKHKQETIHRLLVRTNQLADQVQKNLPAYCICHADIHAGNLLIDDAGELYLVDWDTVILAPKERDLMFIGGGVGGPTWSREPEISWFYRGYGKTEINLPLLAYYRHERILEDIAVYCDALLNKPDGGEDRPVMLRQLSGQFETGDVIDIAFQTDEWLRADESGSE